MHSGVRPCGFSLSGSDAVKLEMPDFRRSFSSHVAPSKLGG